MPNTKYDYSKVSNLVKRGFTTAEIANKIGIPYDTLKRHCRSHNIKPAKRNKEIHNYHQVRPLAKKGLTRKEISHKTGISYSTIKRYCKTHNIVTVIKQKSK